MKLFDKLLNEGKLPDLPTVIELDQKSMIELAIVTFITAVCIALAVQIIKKNS